MRKLIILEINEVPFKVYDHFVKEYPNSKLAEVIGKSAQYITKTTDQGELHPWSTWPTFYRGVDNTKHEIKDIGEDLTTRDKSYPPIWQLLSKSGVTSGVFGSLHTYPLPDDLAGYDFLIPDSFANGDDTLPRKVNPFQAFNLAMTKRSGRSVDRGIDKKRALRLMLSLPGLGMHFGTLVKTLWQVLSEKSKPWLASRRRAFQSILAFDIYLKLLKKHKPAFSTLFSNHVASAMHRYWAATFPEDYEKNDLPKEWIERYKGEILWCMQQLDEMLIQINRFVEKNPEYKVIIASSMGQAATEAQVTSQELFLSDYGRLNEVLGNPDVATVSAMHPQYNFTVSEESADRAEEKLKAVSVNGKPLRFRRKGEAFFSIDLGYPNVKEFEILSGDRKVSLEEMGFEIRKIDDQSGGTAYHIPEGTLFIYDSQNPVKPDRKEVDLREVAPSILKNYGVARADYMREGVIEEVWD